MQELTEMGWLINLQKSQLIPTQEMIYLGSLFNTKQSSVSLPPQKREAIIQKMIQVRRCSFLTASQCMSLIGTMSACIPLVPWSHWHLRHFQVAFLAQWKRLHLSQKISLSASTIRSLHWWTDATILSKSHHLGSSSWITITSDASGQGWGAYCGETRVQGRWPFPTNGIVSNILEIRAAFQALLALTSIIKGQRVLLCLDNRAAVSYLQRQKGAHTADPFSGKWNQYSYGQRRISSA